MFSDEITDVNPIVELDNWKEIDRTEQRVIDFWRFVRLKYLIAFDLVWERIGKKYCPMLLKHVLHFESATHTLA